MQVLLLPESQICSRTAISNMQRCSTFLFQSCAEIIHKYATLHNDHRMRFTLANGSEATFLCRFCYSRSLKYVAKPRSLISSSRSNGAPIWTLEYKIFKEAGAKKVKNLNQAKIKETKTAAIQQIKNIYPSHEKNPRFVSSKLRYFHHRRILPQGQLVLSKSM